MFNAEGEFKVEEFEQAGREFKYKDNVEEM